MWSYRNVIPLCKFDLFNNVLTKSGQLYLYRVFENFYKSNTNISKTFDYFNELITILDSQKYMFYDPETLWNILSSTKYAQYAPPIAPNLSLINNDEIFYSDDADPEYRPYFTNEGLEYLKELLAPRLKQIETVQTIWELQELIKQTPDAGEFGPDINESDLQYSKQSFVNYMITCLLNRYDSRTLAEDNKDISPWDIHDHLKSYIGSDDEYSKNIVNLYQPIRQLNLIVIRNEKNQLMNLKESTVRAIILVYSYMNIDHPFTMYGLKFDNLMIEIEQYYNCESSEDGFCIGSTYFNFGPYSFCPDFHVGDIKMGMSWTNCTEPLIVWGTYPDGTKSYSEPI